MYKHTHTETHTNIHTDTHTHTIFLGRLAYPSCGLKCPRRVNLNIFISRDHMRNSYFRCSGFGSKFSLNIGFRYLIQNYSDAGLTPITYSLQLLSSII